MEERGVTDEYLYVQVVKQAAVSPVPIEIIRIRLQNFANYNSGSYMDNNLATKTRLIFFSLIFNRFRNTGVQHMLSSEGKQLEVLLLIRREQLQR